MIKLERINLIKYLHNILIIISFISQECKYVPTANKNTVIKFNISIKYINHLLYQYYKDRIYVIFDI